MIARTRPCSTQSSLHPSACPKKASHSPSVADVLENAVIVGSLFEALAGTVLSCALTSRRRELTSPLQTPARTHPQPAGSLPAGQSVALVFGNETFGLSIDEVQHCNHLMTISATPIISRSIWRRPCKWCVTNCSAKPTKT